MAASNRQIKRDAAGQPIPQVFDEVADEYQAAKGTDGRQHAILYTADGQAVDLAALVADMAATKAAAVATQVASEAIRAAVEGTLTTQLSGNNTVEPKSGSGNANLTFTAPIVAVQVFNASGAPLTVTVAGDTHIVPDGVPYEVRRADAPFTAVTIAATGPWYAVGLR